MLKLLYYPIAFCAATSVAAECTPQLNPFLYCQIEGGKKEVEVCFNGQEASYRFGPIGGSPELEINQSISEGATYHPWKGIGQAISEAIEFSNDGVTYSTFGGFNRLTAADETVESSFGGITVLKGDEVVASLSCIPATVAWSY